MGSDLGTSILTEIQDKNSEVKSIFWGYTSSTTPTIPAAVSTAPNILIPQNIAFYKIG
jgi:hypothetical protein